MTHLSEHNGQAPAQQGSTDPAQIERDIARQRAELAQTVDALSRKLDVKHRAEDAFHAKVARVRDAATTDTGKPRPDLLAVGAAVVGGVAILLWWRKQS